MKKSMEQKDINYWVKRCMKAEERARTVEMVTALGTFLMGMAALVIAVNFATLVR